jgi:hypothetical protein
MPRHYKPDPYCGFKDDRERRMALNARARYAALACVALATLNTDVLEKFRWLMTLFH